MADYPKRPSHFAHKFVRMLTKVCAAQEIGPEGFTLLTVIAHQEDAKRYAGPVLYYNDQLLPLCGFSSKGRLIRSRETCQASGWLHYEEGGKRRPGRYWVLIPDDKEATQDGPCDQESESICSSIMEQQTDCKRTANGTDVEQQTDCKRTANGVPSTLSLPLNTHSQGNGDKLKGTRLDTPAFRDAWEKWQKHIGIRTGRKRNDIVEQTQLAKLAGLGVEKATRDVLFSIEHDALNLLDSDNDYQKRPTGQRKPAAVQEQRFVDVAEYRGGGPTRD